MDNVQQCFEIQRDSLLRLVEMGMVVDSRGLSLTMAVGKVSKRGRKGGGGGRKGEKQE